MTPHDPNLETLKRHARTRRRSTGPRVHGAFRGRAKWALIDRAGNVARSGEQKNLILDQGLDNIAAYGVAGNSSPWLGYAAVGTGSTAPATSQTALGAEVARTNTSLDLTITEVFQTEYEITRLFEFDFAEANGNLTEWGIAAASSGQLNTRALFLDETDTPTTLTKTSDYKLRLEYTLEVHLSPSETDAAAHDFDITNVGNVAGTHFWLGGSSGNNAIYMFAASVTGTGVNVRGYSLDVDDDTNFGSQSPVPYTAMTTEVYVGGSYQRTWEDVTIPTTQSIGTVAALIYGQTGSGSYVAYAFRIDVADRFTKDDEHVLTLTNPLTITWGRAP